jgi:integrase
VSNQSNSTNNLVDVFSATAVADAVGATPYDSAELTRAVTTLARWAQLHGIPLERESIFARDSIVAHIAEGLAEHGQGTRTNRRSQLLRVAEALLEPALAPRALPAMRASDPTSPYSDEEGETLRNWANTEKNVRACDDALVLLALGLGAGLSAQEVMNVRSADITSVDGVVLVRVTSGRERDVPVLRRWEDVLIRRAGELGGNDYLFKPGRNGAGKNLISNYATKSKAHGVLAQTQRMRTTWLVTQMQAGAPLPELIEAAGVDSLEALTRFLPFVKRTETTTARAQLRAA